MASWIVGSRLLSRVPEFRFSCIGEIRRIDGNLISRERTTALKDFDRARDYIRARPSVCATERCSSREQATRIVGSSEAR